MDLIAFVDTEIDIHSKKILDIGSVKSDGSSFHKASIADFVHFISGSQFIGGHNILLHDSLYISHALHEAGIDTSHIIDTLYLSPLLFPTKPYHSLVKDDKLQSDDTNNPLNDAIKTRDLLYDEILAFKHTDEKLKQIFCLLLHSKKEFQAFFKYITYTCAPTDIEKLIRQKFGHVICHHADLQKPISLYPIELAYCLSLINSFDIHQTIHSVTPPWVLKSYPQVEQIMLQLRANPCVGGCTYCDKMLDIHQGLKRFFGFDTFRSYGGEALQENAVKAAVDNKSILAVFPTGGGKSLTFQLPAFIQGHTTHGLTIVISPLQSLMKDQIDNLEKMGITQAVTINGLLDPIERAQSFERVEQGAASILYISPESLRSKSIERLILSRKIVRFVIDEAHCFSAWGQDFRVDYMYIGDFIKRIQIIKNLEEKIPVSCFTATAKQKVIQDIQDYFREKLDLHLHLYISKTSRTNLHYQVIEKHNPEDKYQTVRDLIEQYNSPTIIYVARTRRADDLAERLTKDGFYALPYHGKMDVGDKTANQNAFIDGTVPIIVATSAFGMGVDKKDVGLVIHYEISDSLENYIQEAGRAGRDQNMVAACYVLYNEEDLSKHFILLNQTKLSIKEIQQVWKAIKEITKFRHTVSNSALEIARKAGWDSNVVEIETRVTTAIAALEDAGYLKRGQNMPRVFANSILSKNAQEAIDTINNSQKFEADQKVKGVRIIKSLFSSKSRKHPKDKDGDARIDYISDRLGIVKEEVINIVNLLREEKILADAQDLTAFIKKGDNHNRSHSIMAAYAKIENFLLPYMHEEEHTVNIKELNEKAESAGCQEASISKIKIILNFWSIKNWLKQHSVAYSKNLIVTLALLPPKNIQEKLNKRHQLARFIVDFLYTRSNISNPTPDVPTSEVLVSFSVHELKSAFENSIASFGSPVSIPDIEDTLFFLSRIDAIKIEGGFLVIYNRLQIERLQTDNYKRYTKDDYQRLHQFYENKIQQIHIVGKYASKMLQDYQDALQFVEDYFQMTYSSFLKKYYPKGKEEELKLKMTPGKFQQLFGKLSPTQLKIIKDNESKYIVVTAGPGSGKTRVLVHKLASLLLMEDVKHEQLLMLTFSRAAATEFKKRLIELIGPAANYIQIKTFHSYCFDLLGKIGSIEQSDAIIQKTIEKINANDVEVSTITKSVLVIDEAQDMDQNEYLLIRTLMAHNEEMRVIAVGDDDQNIYEFRGASSQYLSALLHHMDAVKYELLENYRSKRNLVDFANQWSQQIIHRLKNIPIIAHQRDNGNIIITRHRSPSMITPIVKDILSSPPIGTVGVLTKTNQQALQITGWLLKHGVKAKLIQTNEGFKLFNMVEVRYFFSLLQLGEDTFLISEERWVYAKNKFDEVYHHSTRYEICHNMILEFEATHPIKKYKSDLEAFVSESKLEDFFNIPTDTIVVSTIHKAKGKEFDHVYLMLSHFEAHTDPSKRLLYVAITRAKSNLSIHIHGTLLDTIAVEDLQQIEDHNIYPPPPQLVMQLTYRDIWLDYFSQIQHVIDSLSCGDDLIIRGDQCHNLKGETVLKFSKQYLQQIEQLRSNNYSTLNGKVHTILYWRKEGADKEIKIVLPELHFIKSKYTQRN